MLRLGDFTIQDLGNWHSDYFPGYATEAYDYCNYGVGRTEKEAFEDLLDNLDLNDIEINKIRGTCGLIDDEITSIEASDYSCNLEFPPLFHIGIRYNFLEEERFRQILRIGSLEPLRYASYKPLDYDQPVPIFDYVTKADGGVSYSDFKSDDWPESAEAYFFNLKVDILESGELYFYVPHTAGSDYSGSTVEAANHKYIVETFEKDWIHSVYGRHGTYAIAVSLTGLLQSDIFDDFIEILKGLADYPLISDEALYNLEADRITAAWDIWAQDDFKSNLEEKFGCEFKWPDNLRSFFEEKKEDANEYWCCEGYGPNMYVNIDEVVEEISFEDIKKWAIKYRVSYNNIDIDWYFYVKENAIKRVTELRNRGYFNASYRRI